MVERIRLAAEEPSAANQILLRHSGPILSRGASTSKVLTYYLAKFSPKTYMKMKEIGSRDTLPLDPPTLYFILKKYYVHQKCKMQKGVS